MMICATVSAIGNSGYRVFANGLVSMPISKLLHVTDIKIGDTVLCYFDTKTLSNGVILGKVVTQ